MKNNYSTIAFRQSQNFIPKNKDLLDYKLKIHSLNQIDDTRLKQTTKRFQNIVKQIKQAKVLMNQFKKYNKNNNYYDDMKLFTDRKNNNKVEIYKEKKCLSETNFIAQINQIKAANFMNFQDSQIGIKDFIFLKQISKGAYGRVWKVMKQNTKDIYAMKIINFAEQSNHNYIESLKNENMVFQLIKGDFVIKPFFTFTHETFICFCMEYLEKGDLSKQL